MASQHIETVTKPFSIIQEINEQRQLAEEKAGEKSVKQSKLTFGDVVNLVKKEIDITFKERQNFEDSRERLELNHRALIGDREAEELLTNEINAFLRQHNLLNTPFPNYYDNLAQGIFHETYRFGMLYKWQKMPNSPAAKFQGKEFWIEENDRFVKQEEELASDDVVMDFIRRFTATDETLKVNQMSPTAEIALNDATRVTILIPPAVYKPTLVFRKYVVKNVSFRDQADLGTIPHEDISFYSNLSRLMLNTIIAGHIKSGKSTFLKSMYGERPADKTAVLIEGKPESLLKRDFPDRLVHELYSHNRDINEVIRTALRLDHDYIIVQEVRGKEAEGAIEGTQRGRRGLLMTYHITDPANTPVQLAQHIVDEYPNRNQSREIRRVAKALDLGIIMESNNGKKKVTAVYEIGYEQKSDRGFINYLVLYDKQKSVWRYNSKISDQLIKRMKEADVKLTSQVIEHLQQQEEKSPIQEETNHYINIRDV